MSQDEYVTAWTAWRIAQAEAISSWRRQLQAELDALKEEH